MMEQLQPEKILVFDDDGFIKDPNKWDESIAQLIAEMDGIPVLTSEHWAVIHTLREHYFKYRSLLPTRHICHETHMDRTCMDHLFFRSLREAWRIAGLPNPGEEAKTYMQ
jgi:tRNA 2-thiouridine synthesizing protein E